MRCPNRIFFSCGYLLLIIKLTHFIVFNDLLSPVNNCVIFYFFLFLSALSLCCFLFFRNFIYPLQFLHLAKFYFVILFDCILSELLYYLVWLCRIILRVSFFAFLFPRFVFCYSSRFIYFIFFFLRNMHTNISLYIHLVNLFFSLLNFC